jgi:ribosomal protein S18 acetylase RimI-like enzyme
MGRQLIEAFLAQLRSLGSRGVHLSTTSENEAACRLYENMGFHLLSAMPTRVWEGMIHRPVENRIYGLILS